MIDLGRILIGLIIWNTRKTVYRLRRRQCPCQAPGDSGRAGETRCEASFDYDTPERFHFVCPALARTPDGLRCHLNRDDVKPFWGRCLLVYGILILTLYVLFGTAWFTLLRHRGLTELEWKDVILPSRHQNISLARAVFFNRTAAKAMEEGDLALAIQALSSARASNPSDLRNGLVLARLHEYTRAFAHAEALYSKLLIDFPDQKEIILIDHHDSMLASQRLLSLQKLAAEQVFADLNERNPWLLPWLIISSVASSENARELPPNWNNLAPPLIRALVKFVRDPESASSNSSAQQLATIPASSSLSSRIRWELLWRAGHRGLARKLLLNDANLLGPFEANLGLAITIDPQVPETDYSLFWRDLINENKMSPAQIERIVAVGVTSSRPLPLSYLRIRISNSDRASLSALWVLSIYQSDASLRHELESTLGVPSDSSLIELSTDELPAALFLATSVLPIPREVQYAITGAPISNKRGPNN